MTNKHNKVIFVMIFLILGFAVGLQSKSILKFNKQKSVSQFKVEELQKQLEEEKANGILIKKQIDADEKKSDEFLKAAASSKNDGKMNDKLEELQKLKLMAGLTDVKGKGIEITLDDAPARTNENPKFLIIHDSDIIQVINELKKAGAQAIAINGERLIATSEQVCAGTTIRINMNRYTAPFVITAIGDPDSMYVSADSSDSVKYMIRDHIRIDIKKKDEVVISKYIPNANYKGTKVQAESQG